MEGEQVLHAVDPVAFKVGDKGLLPEHLHAAEHDNETALFTAVRCGMRFLAPASGLLRCMTMGKFEADLPGMMMVRHKERH